MESEREELGILGYLRKPLCLLVGDTGLEPVTSTV